MARNLATLPRTQFSGLTYSNIMQDVINLIHDNPDYNTNWDDFLSADAGRMLIELFAYITEQLASRVDWAINENWIGTATLKKSVMRILDLIGYTFALPACAYASVAITGDTWPGEYYLTEAYDPTEGTLAPFSIQATGRNGVTKTFELLPYDSINEAFDYKTGITVNGDTTLTFYEGTTYIETFTASTDNGQTFTLSNSSIIRNSISVWLVESGVPPETELIEVDSFLDADAQNEQYDDGTDIPIPYKLSVDENSVVTISFGPTSLLSSASRRIAIDDVIRVFYRVGGGVSGNITSRSISTTKRLSVSPIGDPNSYTVNLTLLNSSEATGGQEGETADHARIYGPLQIRTVGKSVTEEDYETLLESHTNVLTAKVYGASNMPDDIFDLYGMYIKPFEVWCYTVIDETDWRDQDASNYNDHYWMSFLQENRFNEIYSIRPGVFNDTDTVTVSELKGLTNLGQVIDYNGTGGDSFFNYVVIETDQYIGDTYFGNANFKLKVSTTGDTTQQFINISDLIVGDSIYVAAGDTQFQITENINAFFLSRVNGDSGINMSTNTNIRIDVDSLGDTTVDISAEAVDTTKVRPYEIIVAINKKLRALYATGGDTYGSANGLTGRASVIESGYAKYIKLTSYLTGDSGSIWIMPPASNDITSSVLGSVFTGDTLFCYGKKRLTLVYDQSAGDTFVNNLIYELGTPNLPSATETYYIHHLIGDTSYVRLGTYFADNYLSTDVKYRPYTDKVYNTQYTTDDLGDTIIDMDNSAFQLRFTGDSTDAMSLYVIDSDWTLTESSPARIVGDSIGNPVTSFSATDYNLRLNIDGKGDTTIDVTGDAGVTGSYSLATLVSNINSTLQAIYTGDTYTTHTYAAEGDTNNIVLISPLDNNISSIVIYPADSNDAMNETFGSSIGDSGDTHIYYVRGDYYLDSLDTNGDSVMWLVKTNNPASGFPDGNVFTHFIWDRRLSTTVDEATYQTYMSTKKITGINNVFKQTRFSTFDIVGTIHYSSNYSMTAVKSAVDAAIHEEYDFIDADGNIKRSHNVDIIKSKILDLIHSVSGVEYVNVTFFGRNYLDSSTNETNTIECDFDEILVISENRSISGVQKHGIVFSYTAVTV